MSVFRTVLCMLAVVGLGACEPSTLQSGDPSDIDAAPEICWDKTVTPAVIETVTEQIIVQAAELDADGTVLTPAIHETRTTQKIVQERTESRFEILCEETMTPEFIMTVQRALQVRTLYYGQINGQLDTVTRAAIRDYQKQQGLDSSILSVDAARKLGLIAVERS